jgi:hypothetical protein
MVAKCSLPVRKGIGVTLVLRRIKWPPDGKPSDRPDYQVFVGETAVGRIYETTVPSGTKWRWSVYGLAIWGAHVPGGMADTLEDAQAQFRAAWDVTEKR